MNRDLAGGVLLALAAAGIGGCGDPPPRWPASGSLGAPTPVPTWSPARRAARDLPVCSFPIGFGPVRPPVRIGGHPVVLDPPCSGMVFLHLEIDASGSVRSSQAVGGDPSPSCVQQARRLVEGWRFEPARWAGPPHVPPEEPGCSFLPGDAVAVYQTVTVSAPRTPRPDGGTRHP
jgi:hypothetical protein